MAKTEEYLSQIKYAEHRNVTKGYISRMVKEGRLHLIKGKLNVAMRRMAEEQQKLEDTERLRETLQAREERKEEERLANDKKGFFNAIDKLEAERRARDN